MSSNQAANQTEDQAEKREDPMETAPGGAAPGGGAAPEGEADTPAAGTATETESPEDLRLMLEDARAKADEHWNALLRLKADMENLRKRAERDVENAHKFGAEQYVSEILPVWDSLEMGLSAASEEGADVEKVREGMELTLKMLTGAMEKLGVSQVDPQGETFDPERHQAMTMQETEQLEPGKVVNVIQKGYTLNERLIRPALVIVAKRPEQAG